MNQSNVCSWRHWSWLISSVQCFVLFRLVRNCLRAKVAVGTKPHTVRTKPHAFRIEPHAVCAEPHAIRTKPHAVCVEPHAIRTKPHAVCAEPHAIRTKPHAVCAEPHAIRTKPHAVCAEPHAVRQTVTRATAACTFLCNDSDGVVLDKPIWTVYLVLSKYVIKDNLKGKISGPCRWSESQILKRVWK